MIGPTRKEKKQFLEETIVIPTDQNKQYSFIIKPSMIFKIVI